MPFATAAEATTAHSLPASLPVSIVDAAARPTADPAAAGSYTEPALASSPGVAALEEKLRAHRAKLESEREALRARRNSRTELRRRSSEEGENVGPSATAGVAAALKASAELHAAASTPPPVSTPTPAEPVPTPKLAVKENAPRTSPVEVPTPAPVVASSAAPPVADAVAEQQRRVAAARSRLWEANCELMAKDRALHDARKRIAATSGPCAADQAVMKKLQRVRSAKELRTLQAGKANEGGDSDCESELTI